MKLIFDYTELRVLIFKKYGSSKNYCSETRHFNNVSLSRKLNNEISFGQADIVTLKEDLSINAKDIGNIFFKLKS